MKHKLCQLCATICAALFTLPLAIPGVSAAQALPTAATGDQTNMGMIIGLSIAGGVALLAIVIFIIIGATKKKKRKYTPRH